MRQWMLDALLGHEGGYVNHPSDPGGETKYGISKRAYPKEDIRGLTKARASDLYWRDYWEKPRLSLLPAGIGYCVFDFGVNAGVSRAVKALQRLVGAAVDGRMGPGTAAAVERFCTRSGEGTLIDEYRDERLRYYRALNKPMFIKGWTRRANEVAELAMRRKNDDPD